VQRAGTVGPAVPVPIPPLAKQQAFSKRFEVVRQLNECMEAAASATNALFNSLSQRAFRGEL
ncbi:MAG: hypothetical protein ACE5FJ_12100, partial [Gemmatimonadales bacterium]